MRLLLIEDDAMIGRAVKHGLEKGGFTVDWMTDGQGALAALSSGVYDLLVLDIGLPRFDGFSVLKLLRTRPDALPVLVISALDAVPDRIAGLNAGADDYLLKPFDLDELIARARALLRRRGGVVSRKLEVGSLELDTVLRVVTQESREVSLTAKEFALLEALLMRAGAVLSRERLEETICGWNDEIGSNAVEVHLHNLRRKLGSDTIKNVRGVGYRIVE